MPTTKPFAITQPPDITRDVNGQITSIVLKAGPIFSHMNQINMDSNGSGRTQGNLSKIGFIGRIDATAAEFSQVCGAVEDMVQGDQRTLEITGTESPTSFSVSAVSVDVPGARLSHVRDLLGPKGETGTGG